MTMMIDGADLDHLSPEQRSLRLKVRNELLASIAHIGESASDREHRERYQRRRAEFLKRKQSPQQATEAKKQSEAWTSYIEDRVREAEDTADQGFLKLMNAIGEVVAEQRRQRQAELGEEIERLRNALRSEIEAKLAALRRRAEAAEARVKELETALTRGFEDAETRARAETRAEFDRAFESQRREFASQLEALKERVGDALARGPAIDQSQVDRAAEAAAVTAVARARAEMRAEYDRA
jgi:hypothetical protein